MGVISKVSYHCILNNVLRKIPVLTNFSWFLKLREVISAVPCSKMILEYVMFAAQKVRRPLDLVIDPPQAVQGLL